ncbi:MAG: hypothetical protein ACREFL_05445 [Stellaceae bacterium]
MNWRRIRRWLGFAAVLLTFGCADTSPPAELRTSIPLDVTGPAAAGVQERAHPPAAPSRKSAALPAGESSKAEDKEKAEDKDSKRAEIGTQGVDRLIGLNESEIESALGTPMLQEDRAPTKLWVFRSRNCTINVTLYPDVETRQFHALAYEVTSDVHTTERTRQCIAEFSSRFSQR